MTTWGEVVPDFLLAIKAGGSSPNTVRYYQMYLIVLERWACEQQIEFDALDRRSFRRYLSYRADYIQPTGKPLAESTRRHDVIVTRKLTKFAKAEGWVKTDPLHGFDLPRAQKAAVKCPTVDEVKALLNAIVSRWDVRRNPKARYTLVEDRTFLRLRDHAIICTILETGARISEVFALDIADLHLSDKKPWVHIRERKGNEPAEIPVTQAYCAAVASWAAHRKGIKARVLVERDLAAAKGKILPEITERFFCSTVQTPIDYSVFRRTFANYLRYGQLERFTRHGIRHLFATLQANQNAVSAMTMLGHKDLKTTQGYVHEQKEQIRRDHAAASPLAEVLINRPAAKPRRKKQV